MTDTKYCLYARKSTESDETQALSIDSQIKEMLDLAKRDNLNVIEIKQEKHSAKEVGQRPIFNEIIKEIREEKFNGILTWAPDRIARNAGDLGTVVDMMDNGKLKEIRTYGQSFGNSPNDKFLLMILGSQAKLENDNKSVNVKRGMKAKCSMGWRPGMAPLGYLTNKEGIKGQRKIFIDTVRSPIIKQMFEKTAFEKYSGRKLHGWLVSINFATRTGKRVTLSSVYSMLKNSFYYGKFEYPVGSGSWYDGLHEPIITKDLFDKVQEQITSQNARCEDREFAFTRLMKCGLCGSGITAEEKHRKLKNGSFNIHVYYGCTRYNDLHCKCGYIREEDLIEQLSGMMDELIMDGSEIKQKIECEIKRYKKFRYGVLGLKESNEKIEETLDHKKYARYILSQGTIEEKRELISFLKGKIFIANGKVSINN
ncbi:MAG: recombinase family protein [Candidatus Paceibacterota bacterium]|jgi:DNA invertase Pin-like site-specific DNA recombinase